jgi:hypothetical protein
VPILGFGQGQSSWDVAQRADLTRTCAEISGDDRLRMAGLGRKDIDVAQIYDCFTITVLMTLEAYGFAARAGRRFCADGNLRSGRRAAGQHVGRPAVGDRACRACSSCSKACGRCAARRTAGAGRGDMHREQPGRHHAHALDADPGACGMTIVGEAAPAMFPVPQPTPLSAPYWRSLDEGRLTFQRCDACGHAWLPARSECPRCWSSTLQWTPASGAATLVSWVIYHHGVSTISSPRPAVHGRRRGTG